MKKSGGRWLQIYIRITIIALIVNISMLSATCLLAGNIYEAEKATLNGAVVATNATGFSGSGFVDYVNPVNDYIEWNITVPEAGEYKLEFQYALAHGNRPLAITVNDVRQKNIDFVATGNFSKWQKSKSLTVDLNTGVNRIRATAIGSSGANIDYLTLTKVTNPNKDEIISLNGSQSNSIKLDSGKVIFKVNEANSNQVTLNYQLNGKVYPAVKLIPELKGSGADNVKFAIIKGDNKTQSGLLLVVSGKLRGSLQFELDRASSYLKLSKITGIDKLRLKFSSSALLLPEMSGEDLIIYPPAWHQQQVNIPGDNHLLVNMIDHGNAMISCIWNNSNIELVQQKSDDGKSFEGIDLKPQRGDILWIGIDAAPHIWFKPQVALNNKATKLQWQPPFPAVWFVTMKKAVSDISAENGHCDTWALADLNHKIHHTATLGVYIVNQDGWSFLPEIGMFSYPFVQKKQDVYLFYPSSRNKTNHYDKNFIPLIYPLQALSGAKQHKLLAYDALKKILSPEVFEHLHIVKSPHNRYQPTCGRTAKIEKIFYRSESGKLQNKVIFYCRDMEQFIHYHRIRIDAYRKWAKKMIVDLQHYASAHPQAKLTVESLIKDLQEEEILYSKVKDIINTPEYFKKLTAAVIKLTKSNESAEDKDVQCKKICRKIRVVGGRQDHLTGMERSVAKAFRVRVTMMLMDPKPPIDRKMLVKMRRSAADIMHDWMKMEGK